MLRLVIDNKALDLYRDDPITIEYRYTDLTDIGSTQASFTQQFRIPLTENNRTVFGMVNDLSAITLYDPKTKILAELYSNSILLLSGYIQIKDFVKQPSGSMDLNIVFFGEVTGLAKAIGNGKLKDLSLSSYDRTLDATTIVDSWGVNKPIRFAVIDRGHNWQGVNTFASTPDQLLLFQVTGMMRVQELFAEVMSAADLTYESDFLDAADDMYMMCNAGGLLNNYADVGVDVGFQIGLSSNYNLTSASPVALPFGTTGVFYDQGGHTSGGSFTVPYTGNYTFKLRIAIATAATGTNRFYLSVNGTLVQTVFVVDPLFDTNVTVWIEPQTYTAGDILQIRAQKVGGSTLTLESDNSLTSSGTSWEMYNVFLGGAAWDCNQNMPDIRQIDWVVALQRAFNLVFIPDRNRPDHFIIEPYADYRADFQLKDWTDKVALDKDIRLTPTSDIQKSVYRWDMATGQDFISQAVFRARKAPYGRWEISDPDNDFATGEVTVKTAFASWITSYIPDTDFPILRLMNDDGEPLNNPAPRLAFWNGLQTIRDWEMSGSTYSTFPVFTEVNEFSDDVAVTSLDLNFGYERKYISIKCNPRNTLYYQYYHPMIGELYSSDARFMTCFLKLDAQDVATFTFGDRIVIKNEAYRIYKIKYVANDESAYAEVTLQREVPSDRLCTYIPFSVDKAGQLTFETPTGGTLTTVPRGCCELFGHRYDALTSTCWGNLPLE